MTYLTQILVDKRDVLHHRMTDSYAWHQALWKAFPAPPGASRSFLSRVDHLGQNYRVYLLTDSAPVVQPWGEWTTREIALSFLNCTHYRFDLRANPTVKRVVRDVSGQRKKNGQRTAIYDPTQLHKWLKNKGEQNGFEILNVEVGSPIPQLFRRKGKPGKHVRVDFQGVLGVFDRERFQTAFETGIGSAKAFGFGMLVLQPLA